MSVQSVYKNIATRNVSWPQKSQNAFAAGATPRTPMGSLQRSPRLGQTYIAGLWGGEGKERRGEERRKREEGKSGYGSGT